MENHFNISGTAGEEDPRQNPLQRKYRRSFSEQRYMNTEPAKQQKQNPVYYEWQIIDPEAEIHGRDENRDMFVTDWQMMYRDNSLRDNTH